MGRAVHPELDDAPGAELARSPGEVLAEQRSPGAGASCAALDVAVLEDVPLEQVGRMALGRPGQPGVAPQRPETVVGPNTVDLGQQGARRGGGRGRCRRHGERANHCCEDDRDGREDALGGAQAGDYSPRLGGGKAADLRPEIYLAVCARKMPASTTAPPTSWTGASDSPSHAQATAVAATGSSIAVMPTRVAEM